MATAQAVAILAQAILAQDILWFKVSPGLLLVDLVAPRHGNA